MVATMIMGLPGSGKSTTVKTIAGMVVNKDSIRSMIYAGYDFRKEDEAMIAEMAFTLARCIALSGKDIIIDETFVNTSTRIMWIELLKSIGYTVNGIYMDTPIEVCIARRQEDDKGMDVNWEGIIKAMSHGYKRPTLAEGYDSLEINNKGY